MSLTVFLAIIFSAFLHAIWNAMVKKEEDKYISLTAAVLTIFFGVILLKFFCNTIKILLKNLNEYFLLTLNIKNV